VPRQRSFQRDLRLINDVLTSLIRQAQETRNEADAEELKEREYESASDPSLLRFLVDLRGEEATDKQLRDDLMTMLVAGHETTASVLTWATYCLALDGEQLRLVQEEVDSVLADKVRPDYDDVKAMPRIRRAIAESLRLYPQPPLLIRRALEDVELPGGEVVSKGQDVFLSVYNIHRSPEYWNNPNTFDLTRWDRRSESPEQTGDKGWQGYNPEGWKGLYPNETASDYAFLPYGGGATFAYHPLKCPFSQRSMLLYDLLLCS
jgi:cytochrome P450